MAETKTQVIEGEVIQEEIPSTDIVLSDEKNGTIVISQEQAKKYAELTKNIKSNDINSISNYGADLQNTMSKYSSTFLKDIRLNQTGEVGQLIDSLLNELGQVDVRDLSGSNSFVRFMRKVPIVKGLIKNVEKMLAKYDSIEKSVETIAGKIQANKLLTMADNKRMEMMFENNKQYVAQIKELIIAGKLMLQQAQDEMSQIMANPQGYETYEIQDKQHFANVLEKRIHDLMGLQNVMEQSLFQIRLVQKNNIEIIQKADAICSTTIPVWRNALSIAVALYNQRENIEMQKKVSDTTNEILKRNAELLHTNSVAVARENERSIIDNETLKKTTEELIATIKEVQQIHNEGIIKRRESERELQTLSTELQAHINQALDTMDTPPLLINK